MIKLNTLFPLSFYNQEERSGFSVPVIMKEVWAVELDLLLELKRVLDKYELRWYAIGGTLLGAVRHGGFIPWDDDIDIAMPRVDYDRLQQIAEKEFAYPYFYQDEYSDPGVLFGHAKLRNSKTTGISSNYLEEKHGECSFNMGIFIDIFPIDNIPDDSKTALNWEKSISDIAQLAWRFRKYTHRHLPAYDGILERQVKRLQDEGDINMFFKMYNDALSFYYTAKTKEICLYSLYCKEKRWRFSSDDFKEVIMLPFENIEIPVPAGYEHILTQLYQDWKVLKQLPTMHSSINGSLYDTDCSYMNYFHNGCLDRAKVRDVLAKRI